MRLTTCSECTWPSLLTIPMSEMFPSLWIRLLSIYNVSRLQSLHLETHLALDRTFSDITSRIGQPHYSGDMLALVPVSDSRLHRLSSVSLGSSTGTKDSTWVPAEGSGPVDHTEGLRRAHRLSWTRSTWDLETFDRAGPSCMNSRAIWDPRKMSISPSSE